MHSARNPSGHVIITDPDAARPLERDTLQCVHCGEHWVVQHGSGIKRGWCPLCNGPFCGKKCEACVPFEKWLEIVEGTKNPTAVSIAVPSNLPIIGSP